MLLLLYKTFISIEMRTTYLFKFLLVFIHLVEVILGVMNVPVYVTGCKRTTKGKQLALDFNKVSLKDGIQVISIVLFLYPYDSIVLT